MPAPVLAQAWRGSSQRALVEALKGAIVEPLDEELARSAGELLGRTGTSDVIDATVAVSAARRADIVITSDPDHLQRLADDLSTIRVLRV
ncbi:MAG: hypothetical protein QOE86_4233 [Solirubrobacteraceae bacterium]|nr:hypothetical protein [Solirubrobacteraceae bacterium]